MTFQPPPSEPDPGGQPPAPPPSAPPASPYPPPPPAQQAWGYGPPWGYAQPEREAPVGQQWAPPAGTAPGPARGLDPKSVHPLDWAIVIAGLLALIFSFLPYYTGATTASLGTESLTRSSSISAWNGFFGWFAALVAVAASLLLALSVLGPAPGTQRPVLPPRVLVFGGYVLATICVVLAWFVTPGARSAAELKVANGVPLGVHITVDYGRGVGFYLSLAVIIVGLLLTALRMRRPVGGARP